MQLALRGVLGMKYVCLLYCDEEGRQSMATGERLAYDEALWESGHCIAWEILQPAQNAVTLSMRDGELCIADGPVVRAGGQLAAFYLIKARDLHEGLGVAAGIPPSRLGALELRPIAEHIAREIDPESNRIQKLPADPRSEVDSTARRSA